MNRLALTAEAVTRIYSGTRVVDAASLTLQPGRIFALVGASGAGKSTLLRLLAGLEPVDEGEIRIGGEILSRRGMTVPPERRRTGLIFQDFALFPHMTALQNVRFGLNSVPRENADPVARGWLARVGLEERAAAYPHQLSGGEQQRIAIARALAARPAAILMDEPFSGLDPTLRSDVADTALAAIRESDIPALLVSHDAPAAMDLADDLAVMRNGRIVQCATPREVYEHPVDAGVAAALGRTNEIIVGMLPEGLLPAGLEAAPDSMVCVRCEAVRIDPAGPVAATVVRSAFAGAVTRLLLDTGPVTLSAEVPSRGAPTTGEGVRINLDPALTFVFSGNVRSAQT